MSDVASYVAESRRRQGLPRFVESTSTAAQIVGLLGYSIPERDDAAVSNTAAPDNTTRRIDARVSRG